MESRSAKAASEPALLPPAPPPLRGLPPVHDPLPHPELLSSLGRMVRGLSLLFWGLPVALVVCVQSAKGDWFRPLGIIPSLIATGLLYYGLVLLSSFQKQERPWMASLDRTKLVGVINLGLSPFLYWWNRVPAHPFLTGIVEVLMITGLLFLILLNPLLCRLTAMLPDETLRAETRLFTSVNTYVLVTLFVFLAGYVLAIHVDPSLPDRCIGWLISHSPLPQRANAIFYLVDRNGALLVLFVILLPVAMTMALVWKIKEVILASVFGPIH
jgi:hypothetical protein